MHVPIVGVSLMPVVLDGPVLLPLHVVQLELIIDPACSLWCGWRCLRCRVWGRCSGFRETYWRCGWRGRQHWRRGDCGVWVQNAGEPPAGG
jgi:hypothetical protein